MSATSAPLRISPKLSAQYCALLRRHALSAKRGWGSTLVQVGLGLAVCLLIAGFQRIANSVLGASDLHPPVEPVVAPPRCMPGASSVRWSAEADGLVPGCNTLLFAPLSPSTELLMRRVAADAGLVYGEDVAPLPGTQMAPPFNLTLANISSLSVGPDGHLVCPVDNCAAPGNRFGDCQPCALAADNATITNWLLNNPNSTQNVVWFIGAYAGLGALAPPIDRIAAIFYNFSLSVYPFYADTHAMSVKAALDAAALEVDTGRPLSLRVAQRPFPVPPPRVDGYDVFSGNGGQWCFVVPMVAFFSILVELVHEKEARLRVGMRQMGLRVSAFWAAWLTYGLVLGAASTAVMLASGYALGFTFFRNTSLPAVAALFFAFNVSMLAFAVFLSSLLSTAKAAQTVGYSFILLGFVLQFILTSAYAGLVDLLYSDSVAPWVVTVRRLLTLYPPFNFSLMFYDISALSSSTIDFAAGTVIAGPGFHWADLFIARTRVFAGFTCSLPSPATSLALQFMDTALFLALALYLDSVLPGPAGSPAHPLFCCGFRYATNREPPPPPQAATSLTVAPTSPRSAEANLAALRAGEVDAGVAEESRYAAASRSCSPAELEAAAAAGGSGDGRDAPLAPILRVSHLRVVYRRSWSAALYALTGIDASSWGASAAGGAADDAAAAATNATASGDVLAVRDLSFTVHRGEIFALLGHNGSGKTSTISSLTGLFAAAGGTASILGHDTAAAVDEVQKVMGVCPQHDVLWPALTADETLRLFAAIKGVTAADADAEVARVLHEVRLTAVRHRRVGGYSGGMRRRLSVAIAALGRPPCFFLDECSTGLDPVHREKVWRLVQRLKRGAAVVLTTHNMEEANALATRVGIMAHGRLVALGSPLRLKAAYGAGYRLNLVLADAAPSTCEAALAAVRAHAPGATVALRDAANVSLVIPFAAVAAMPRVLDWAEGESAHGSGGGEATAAAARGLLREHSVSGPTLESVFIAVSAAARFDLAQSTEAAGAGVGAVDDGLDEDERQFLKDTAGEPGEVSRAALTGLAPKRRPPASFGYRALAIKNLTLIVRQRGLCLCQVITPLLVLGFLLLLQVVIRNEAGIGSSFVVPSLLLPLNMNQWYAVTRSIPANRRGGHEDDDDNYGATAPSQDSHLAPFALLRETQEASLRTFVSAAAAMEQEEVAEAFGGEGLFRGWQATAHALRQRVCAASESQSSFARGALCVATAWASELGSPPRSAPASVLASAPADPSASASPTASAAPSPPPYPPGSNTDCLTFLLFAVSADGSDGRDDASLATAVGAQPRLELAWPQPSPLPTPANISVNASGLLGGISTSWCQLKNASMVPQPFFIARGAGAGAGAAMDVDLNAALLTLNNASNSVLDFQPPCWRPAEADAAADIEGWACPAYLLADGAIDFHALANLGEGPGGAGVLAYTLQLNDLIVTRYHRPNNLTRLGLPSIPRWASRRALTIEPGKLALMESLHGAYAASQGGPAASALPAVTLVASYPTATTQNFQQYVEIVGAVLHPITLSLQLPLFVFVTVLEKEERLVELQRAMGLRYLPYVATTYAVNLAMYVGVAGMFWAAGAGVGFTFFAHTSPALLALVFLGWGLALCSLAQLISAFLWSRQAATIVGYVVALFGNLLAIIVAAGIYGNQIGLNTNGLPMPNWLLAFPSFGLVRFLYLGTFHCIALQACYKDVASALAPGSEERAAVVSLYLAAAGYLAAAVYLDQVLPRRFGVAKHPLFCLPARWQVVADSAVRTALDFAHGAASATVAFVCCRRNAVIAQLPPPAFAPLPSSAQPASLSLNDASGGDVVAAATKRAGIAGASGLSRLFPHARALFTEHGLSPATAAAAVVNYAAGEDSDVTAARVAVEVDVWPRAVAEHARQRASRAASRIATCRAACPWLLGYGSSGVHAAAGGYSRVSAGDEATATGTGAVASASTDDTVFEEFPVILRHLRKVFPVPVPAPVSHTGAASSGTGGAEAMHAPLLLAGSAADASATSALSAPLSGPPYLEAEQKLGSATGSKVAVSDLSLALRANRVFGALGENGAGKSTLVSMLMGLAPPSAGAGFVAGRDLLTEPDEVRASLGVCLQQDILWPSLTVAEHIAFYARLKGVPPRELDAHVAAAARRVGLAQFAGRAAGALSGGMKRRLSLAIALAGDSAMILADEVTTGLDPGSKRTIWRIIEGARAGRVWVLVSHDMTEVETLCDDIGVMTWGRLRALGPPARLKARYGGGYVLQVSHEAAAAADGLGGAGSGDAAARVASAVTSLFPGASLHSRFSGFAAFTLPPALPDASMPNGSRPIRLSTVFATMQAHAAAAGITDWQVGQATLDTVFSRLVNHFRADGGDADEADDDDE